HVVGYGPQVVEELAVDRPAMVALPERRANHLLAKMADGLAQGEGTLAAIDDVAEPLVPGGALVGGRSGRGEPTFVDAAAARAIGIKVLRSQLETAARHQERAWHPGRGQPQNAGRRRQRLLDESGTGLFRIDGIGA